MARGFVRGCVVAAVIASGSASAPGAARAQSAAPSLDTPAGPPLDAAALPPRPRLSLAAGVGSTFDAAGFTDGRAHAIPSFFAVGGFGDGLAGVDLGSFGSSASGRFRNDNPVDRLALDAFGVVRPAARIARGDQRYRMRVARLAALELGLGLERDGRPSGPAGSRFTVHTGARVELPLARAGEANELRLRLAVRHDVGLFTPKLYSGGDVTSVGDTTEVYGALAVVF